MPSNSSTVQQGGRPASASNVGCEGLSFTSRSGALPSTLECHVLRQTTLATQTPYERRRSGFSPGDTGILLGQKDFNATLNRPGVKKFASIRQPPREGQLAASTSSGVGNKTWGKIFSWGKITFGKNKGGDGKKTSVENGQTGRSESDEQGPDAVSDRERPAAVPQRIRVSASLIALSAKSAVGCDRIRRRETIALKAWLEAAKFKVIAATQVWLQASHGFFLGQARWLDLDNQKAVFYHSVAAIPIAAAS